MYESSQAQLHSCGYHPMLRMHVSGFPDICRSFAVISVHMSKRCNDPANISPEPAAKRQRILTSAAGPQEDIKV